MPHDRPTVGETWELSDPAGRLSRGIIAEINDTMVVLVSLTGSRVRVPAGRFPESWRFVAAPPVTAMRCSRCRVEPGILLYQTGTSPDYRCPRHVPVGVLAKLHATAEVPPEDIRPSGHLVLCPQCGSPDPVEDMRTSRFQRESALWTCPLCACRWGLIEHPGVGQEDDGRWYVNTVLDLLHEMTDHGMEVTEIHCSPATWIAIRRLPYHTVIGHDDSLRGPRLGGAAIYLSTTLPEGSVLLRATNAPVARVPRGVHRLTLGELNRRPALPVVGEIFYEKRTGQPVRVIQLNDQEGQYSVAVQRTEPTTGIALAPFILGWNEFWAWYGRSPAAESSNGYSPVELGEEWKSIEHNEYLKIVAIDPVRMAAVTRSESTSKTRNVPLNDFSDPSKYTRLVRLTAHQRLMKDDEF